MSEKKFKEAKGQLAFSQQLVDKMKSPSQQAPPMAQEQPKVPSQETNTHQSQAGIIDSIKELIQPLTDKLNKLFTNQEENKQVELKIEGEMSPKE